jgi:hypothetical protein
MAFWKKIFKSKYTGAEIDAAVAKAGNLPATTSADAGKALVVDDEGKIVAGEAGGGVTILDFNLTCTIKYSDSTLSARLIAQDFTADQWASLMTAVEKGTVWLKVNLNSGTGVDSVSTSYTYIIINGFMLGEENVPEIVIFSVGGIVVGTENYVRSLFTAIQFGFDERHGLHAEFGVL